MRILALDGDGISSDILPATLEILRALDLDIEIENGRVGFKALEAHGTTITDKILKLAFSVDGIILGPVSHNEYPPVAEGGLNPSGVLRKTLDLYANIRPARSFTGVDNPIGRPVDLVVVRENTEGFYADRNMVKGIGEFMPTDDLALALRKVSRHGSRRIAEQAFELAAASGRKVTAVHKANVLRVSDGLFLEEVRKVAHRFPDIVYDEVLVDAAAALLVRDPSMFEIIVTTNMFGDILSDLASELAGGLGLAGSLNQGDEYAMAQAQHGSAPDIAGQDVANPTSLILSLVMLLKYLAKRHRRPDLDVGAVKIEQAVESCLALRQTRTRDLEGILGTRSFTKTLINHLK